MTFNLDLNTILSTGASAALIATAKILWSTSVKLAGLTARVDGHETRLGTIEEKVLS